MEASQFSICKKIGRYYCEVANVLNFAYETNIFNIGSNKGVEDLILDCSMTKSEDESEIKKWKRYEWWNYLTDELSAVEKSQISGNVLAIFNF